MKTLKTSRLIIDEITVNDASLILALLNDPDFIRYVADRGIRTEEQAQNYISGRVMASYAEHGFGMAAVRRKDTGKAVGMCGLVKRDALKDVDIGYAFLPEGRGQGYALEAAEAVMAMGRKDFGLSRLSAIIHPDNAASIALARALGMQLDSLIRMSPDDEEIRLYLWCE